MMNSGARRTRGQYRGGKDEIDNPIHAGPSAAWRGGEGVLGPRRLEKGLEDIPKLPLKNTRGRPTRLARRAREKRIHSLAICIIGFMCYYISPSTLFTESEIILAPRVHKSL